MSEDTCDVIGAYTTTSEYVINGITYRCIAHHGEKRLRPDRDSGIRLHWDDGSVTTTGEGLAKALANLDRPPPQDSVASQMHAIIVGLSIGLPIFAVLCLWECTR